MNIIFKSKKPFISFIKRDKKLFISFQKTRLLNQVSSQKTRLQIRSKNNTTILIPKKNQEIFLGKKGFYFQKPFVNLDSNLNLVSFSKLENSNLSRFFNEMTVMYSKPLLFFLENLYSIFSIVFPQLMPLFLFQMLFCKQLTNHWLLR